MVSAQVGDAQSVAGARPTEPKMAVVAFGRCGDLRLGQAARGLRAELHQQQGPAVLSEDDTAVPGGGLPRSTLEEIRRAIDSGRTDFANQNYGKAIATLRGVLPEIDRLPPGADRWAVAALARVELAHVAFFNEWRAQTAETFFEVLRIEEDLKLEPLNYPPSLRRALEDARAAVRRARRFKLRVVSREPGQPVFVNGRELGKTPFERRLVGGNYDVVVGDATAHSFARHLELHSDRELNLDVAPEVRFKATEGPCYEADATREQRLAAATLVASALSVDQIATVRFEQIGGEEYAAAALFEVSRGREVREGRQRTDRGQVTNLKNLATFVLTGDSSVLEPPKPEPKVDLAKPESVAKEEVGAAPSKFPWLRAGGIALGVAAVGLAVAALVENGQAGKARSDVVSALGQGLSSRAGADRVSAALERYDSAKQARTVLGIVAAGAAVGSGTMLVFSIAPSSQGSGGGARGAQVAVGVAGSFP
jgi:hypothetical protein